MSAVSLPERFVGEILRIHPGGLTVEQSSAGRCGEGRPHAQSAHCIRPKAGGSCTQLAHKVARPTVELLVVSNPIH